jgi:hypothetical protein
VREEREEEEREEFLHIGPSPHVIHVTKTTQQNHSMVKYERF